MGATLTYFGRPGEPGVTFVLDCPTTVVGRRPRAAAGLPGVAERVEKREPFCARLGDTLYIGIPNECLARDHFAIRRAVGPSGESVYLIRDLGTFGGFWLNGAPPRGEVEVPLRAGDRIGCGGGFAFGLEPAAGDFREGWQDRPPPGPP